MQTRKLFTKLFWIDTFERTVATAGETFIGVLAGGLISAVNWKAGITTIATASVAAVVKAMVAAAKADTDTASFTVDTKELKQ